MSDLAHLLASPRVDAPHRAGRISLRPLELGNGGAYRLGGKSGALTGAGANTPVFSFRWGSDTHLALVTAISWWWFTQTAFTAAQVVDHALFVARGFTASDSAQTALTPAGNDCKKRTSYPTSKATDVRISNTGAITVGTRALDAQHKGSRGQWSNAVGAQLQPGSANFWFPLEGEGPIILAQNEGLVLQNLTAMGATGVIRLFVDLAWLEVPIDSFGGGE